MKDYFLLQYNMVNRQLHAAGVNPPLGYIASIGGSVFLFDLAFQKTEFAKYLILLVTLSFLLKLSEKKRTEFLSTTFGDRSTHIIRSLENLIVSLPGIGVLLYHSLFLEALLLCIACAALALLSFKSTFNFTIPTPFYKNPFEFTAGFRKTYPIYPIAYFITIAAIDVGNTNLGLFAMLLVFLVALSFYTKPENEYYVWVHALTSKEFIFMKLTIASKNVTLLSLPILLSLLYFFWHEVDFILLFFFVCFLFLWIVIIAKYVTFPNEMNIQLGITIVLCFYFPPLLLAILPYYFYQSVKNLNTLLP